ncbi:MAG: FkbM family methyltransferase [Acidobacteria bacterium]|nr:FkbM family methyltransferase [Acidobacteriota bacterium]
MSRFDRAVGLARSLAIYHLVPRRQATLRALYGRFVAAGDLVFDVGAHVGNRTRAFLALGCQVVALEPQPAVAAMLRTVVGGDRHVRIVQKAVSGAIGRARLAVSERTPTVSTLADDWRDQRRQEPGFAGVEWNDTVEVDTTTLDALIAEYGVPTFVKLDIEGGEAAALAGLTQPVPTVSFEFLPQALGAVRACGERLEALGPYRYNWTPAESHRLASDTWLTLDALVGRVTTDTRHGDVVATLEP